MCVPYVGTESTSHYRYCIERPQNLVQTQSILRNIPLGGLYYSWDAVFKGVGSGWLAVPGGTPPPLRGDYRGVRTWFTLGGAQL